MSKLLNKSHHHSKQMLCFIQTINCRYNSTNTNQELLSNLASFASERIMVPQKKEVSFRPRYKNLSIPDDDPTDLISATDNFLQPSDFMMSKFLPVHSTQNFIDFMHDYVPYWGAIIIAPFLAKLCITMPLTILSQRSQEKIYPLIPTAMKEYRKAANKYRGEKEKFNKMSEKIVVKYGFNPLYAQFRPMVVAIVQMPIHMTFYVAFRTMYSSYPDWKVGGLSWFSNLSVADPYWILPVSVGAAMGLSFWNSMRIQDKSGMVMGGGAIPPGLMKGLFGTMGVLMIPMAHFWSAGFNLYMSANILSYMMQIVLLQYDPFRAIFGLKPVSFQFQYQRELRDINSNANSSMKQSMDEDVSYSEISDKHARRRRIHAQSSKNVIQR